jgi:hypothetical protein
MIWDKLGRREGEPLAHYVGRLEQIKKSTPVMNAAEQDALGRALRDAKGFLRMKRAKLRDVANTGNSGNGPTLKEVMSLFGQLSEAERQPFFLWFDSGMPDLGGRQAG